MNHKKHLDYIYNRHTKQEHLGMDNEVSIFHNNNTVKNSKFKEQERNMMITKTNDILYNKINKIKHRENVIDLYELETYFS